jgi:two-component system chemotaxis sensor kinase CheA
LVHDLAAALGRQALLDVEGADTEVDRSVLDPVRDLFIHLVRNAIVHGLETPEERQTLGKPEVGTVRIAARSQENGVLLEVSDDGRGLSRERLAARAVALGLCTASEVELAPDEWLWSLLTQSGLSTYSGVDAVAGRGIGLSAVRRGVEALNGRLELGSVPGQGTTVRLWLPSMFTLEEVVLACVASEVYAIPQSCIERVYPYHHPVDVPTVDLRRRLAVADGDGPGDRILIACRRDDGPVGLLADRVVGRDEVVIRPLPRRARRPELLGAVVSQDGRVVLVLDIQQL